MRGRKKGREEREGGQGGDSRPIDAFVPVRNPTEKSPDLLSTFIAQETYDG
jgi:hypothetical protein